MASVSTTAIGDVATTSCERCRRRKIKCDRQQPCANCEKAGNTCVISGSGEKQRPVPKSYVQALERNVAFLELFIQQLAGANDEKRDGMLAGYVPMSKSEKPIAAGLVPEVKQESSTDLEMALARARAGQLRKLRAGNTSQFFGGTSLFQMHVGDDVVPSTVTTDPDTSPAPITAFSPSGFSDLSSGQFPYSPHDDTCQALMARFFKEQYPYSMCVYREFFLRDYDTGAGRYYSEVLLYAICAMGALASAEPSMLSVSEIFASQAEFLVYTSLDKPDLTLLQALILLGYRFIGHGKASKGWLFCGMAFRLAHEMGLHLDPNNWHGTAERQLDRDREILRRVYWAAFNADKQVSLYFGRPPALYPHESDVRNTIRIPYPEDFQGLLETYIAKDTSVTAYEDGIALSGSFIYRTELYKIIHTMITDLFENRRQNADSAVLAATAQRIHLSLHKWLATLPGKLYWNQWSSGQVQPFVLHLHMLFHTSMIILHRPPRHLFSKAGVAQSEDVEICYESLQAMLRLMKSYSRFYEYTALPLDFVHTLSVTAGTILMKRFLENSSQEDTSISKPMEIVLDAMDKIKYTWPCIIEIRESILQALETRPLDPGAQEPNVVLDFGFLADFVPSGDAATAGGSDEFRISDADLGLLLNNDFVPAQTSWDETYTGPASRFSDNF
ncbi:fungal-specific transcription factor domain-containing protein [Xylariales sp. PMI_506]|nr:fungal-specific transcription factor domain-containing protein [Xylariales sp. PMI_506]